MAKSRCPQCLGAGKVRCFDARCSGGYVTSGEQRLLCPNCNGNSFVDCTQCFGTGSISVPDESPVGNPPSGYQPTTTYSRPVAPSEALGSHNDWHSQSQVEFTDYRLEVYRQGECWRKYRDFILIPRLERDSRGKYDLPQFWSSTGHLIKCDDEGLSRFLTRWAQPPQSLATAVRLARQLFQIESGKDVPIAAGDAYVEAIAALAPWLDDWFRSEEGLIYNTWSWKAYEKLKRRRAQEPNAPRLRLPWLRR